MLSTPFVADRLVGGRGAWAWTTPDQTAIRTGLAPNLPLQIVSTRGDWLLVRSASGWFGWTVETYLVPISSATAWPSPFGGGPLPPNSTVPPDAT